VHCSKGSEEEEEEEMYIDGCKKRKAGTIWLRFL